MTVSIHCSTHRLTHRFANQKLTLTLGLTSHTLFYTKFWHEATCHKLTEVITLVNLMVNPNPCLEHSTTEEAMQTCITAGVTTVGPLLTAAANVWPATRD